MRIFKPWSSLYHGPVSKRNDSHPILELEVERLPPREESGPRDRRSEKSDFPGRTFAGRLRQAFDPVAAGLLIDALDAMTRGPLAPLGLLIGLPLGYWLGRRAGLGGKQAVALGLGIGIYCAVPFTSVLPLGTLTGVYLRFWRD